MWGAGCRRPRKDEPPQEPRERVISIVGTNEVKTAHSTVGLCKALLAEALGTLFITYYGILSCIAITPPPASHPSTANFVLIALCFGFLVMVAVQALGHVSGANLNPAVTCGLAVTGRITIIRALLYVIAQCVGAIAGAGLAKALTPKEVVGALGMTLPHKSLSALQALFVEFMLGFLLVFVVFGVIDPNKPESKIPASLAIGLAVSAGHLSSIDYTGSSMNPARSLGPAVIMGNFDSHWVYWAGPCLGGVAAALLYTIVFYAPEPESSKPSVRAPSSAGEVKSSPAINYN